MDTLLSKKGITLILIFLGVIFFSSFTYLALFHYPYIGADYSYHTSKLIEGADFIKKNFFSIQYFSRSLGGIPFYGLPENNQFSLLQFFFTILPPLYSYFLTVACHLGLGVLGSFLFLHFTLQFSKSAAIIGVALWITNGFFSAHLLQGHYSYVQFQEIPLIFFLYFQAQKGEGLEKTTFLLLAALLSASFIYSGGYFTTLLLFLTILLMSLLFKLKFSIIDYILLTALTLLFSLSRLVAIIETLPLLSHDYKLPGGSTTLLESFKIIGSSLFLSPKLYFRGSISDIIGYWEFILWVSPLGLCLIPFIKVKNLIRELSPYLFLRWLLITIPLILFSGGFFVDYFAKIPILKSYWIPMRFGALLILPLITLYLILFNRFLNLHSRKAFITFVCSLLIILGSHFLHFYSIIKKGKEVSGMWYYADKEIFLSKIKPLPPITNLISYHGDDITQLEGKVNLRGYESDFGYYLEGVLFPLWPGKILTPIRDSSEGISHSYFLMRNPACLVYPKENGCRKWSLIKEEDLENLNHFIRNEATSWKISTALTIANVITLLSLITALAIITFRLLLKYRLIFRTQK